MENNRKENNAKESRDEEEEYKKEESKKETKETKDGKINEVKRVLKSNERLRSRGEYRQFIKIKFILLFY